MSRNDCAVILSHLPGMFRAFGLANVCASVEHCPYIFKDTADASAKNNGK